MDRQDLWKDSETDGDRYIKRRAQEHAGAVEHIARDLKEVAQRVKDADSGRIKRIIQVQVELAQAAERLKDLGGTA